MARIIFIVDGYLIGSPARTWRCSHAISFRVHVRALFRFFPFSRFLSSLSLPFVGIPQRYARNRRVRRGDRKLIACTAIDPLIISLRRPRERLLPLTRKSHRPRSNVPMLFPRLRVLFFFFSSFFFFDFSSNFLRISALFDRPCLSKYANFNFKNGTGNLTKLGRYFITRTNVATKV